MKRLISAALALSLLGTTAAIADPYHGGHGYRGGYEHGYRHHGGDGAAVLGLGLGLFALAAIASSHDHDRYDEHYYNDGRYGPPPPPPRGYDGYDRPY